MNKIQEAFAPVKAPERLKHNTLVYVQEERVYRRHREKNRIYRYAAVLTALVLLSGIYGHSVLNKAVAFIGVDGSPSLELALNRMNHVVDVQAYNEDGSSLMKKLNLEGKSYTEAINLLFTDPDFLSYMENNPDIAFTVVSKNPSELINGIENCDSYVPGSSTCAIYDQDIMTAAHGCGLSVAKYQAYLDLCQYDDGITTEECRNMSIRDLRSMLSHHVDTQTGEIHDSETHNSEIHTGNDHTNTHDTDEHDTNKTRVKIPTATPVPTQIPSYTSHDHDTGHSYDADHNNDTDYCEDYSYNYDSCDNYSYNYDSCDDYSYSSGSHHSENHGSGHH